MLKQRAGKKDLEWSFPYLDQGIGYVFSKTNTRKVAFTDRNNFFGQFLIGMKQKIHINEKQ